MIVSGRRPGTITADGKADNASDQRLVPLGGGAGKILMVGKLPFDGSLAISRI